MIIHETRPIGELVSKTHFFIHRRKDVYAMTLLATVIALVGLISNNIAVIIGAMLIAPFMGPISSIALSSILGKQKEINDSLIFGAELIVSSIILASVVTFVLSLLILVEVTPEIQARTEDRAFAIIVALLLGMAGGLSLVTAIPEIIVGVAIAVALIPPAAVVGIGLGLGDLKIMIGAALVTISNIIGLILGFLIIFMLKGVSPVERSEKIRAKRLIVKNMTILIGLAISLGAIIIYFP
ncbi:MAG: TIGR00341 family protein [Nitrososphaeraceae archaeon]